MREDAKFLVFVGYENNEIILDFIAAAMKFSSNQQIRTLGLYAVRYPELLINSDGFPLEEKVDYVICTTTTPIKTINILLELNISVLAIINIIDAEDLTSVTTTKPKHLLQYTDHLFLKLADDYYLIDTHSASYKTELRKTALTKVLNHLENSLTSENKGNHERILVLLDNNTDSTLLVKKALDYCHAHMAKLTVIYFGSEKHIANHVLESVNIAKEYGAHAINLVGGDMGKQVVQYAILSQVSKIMVQNQRTISFKIFYRSLMKQIIKNSSKMDIIVLPIASKSTVKLNGLEKINTELAKVNNFIVFISVFIMMVLVSFVLSHYNLPDTNIVMINILGVLVISVVTSSYIWSLLASVLSVLVYNYLFMEPQFALSVSAHGYPLTIAIMLVVSFGVSFLTKKMFAADSLLAKKAYRTEILLETSLKLQNVRSKSEALEHIGNQLNKLTEKTVVIFTNSQNLKQRSIYTTDSIMSEDVFDSDYPIISELFLHQNDTPSLIDKTSNFRYFTVCSDKQSYAIIGIEDYDKLISEIKDLTNTIINDLGFTLEAIQVYNEKINNEYKGQKDKLRLKILRTISHDFRTPLTSISGNVDILLTKELSETTKMDIYRDLKYDISWLNNMVENLLAMTRLEHSNNSIEMEKQIIGEIIEEAISRIKQRYPVTNIEFMDSNEVVLVEVNIQLMIQLFVNLIDNAIKYSHSDKPIVIKVIAHQYTVSVSIADYGIGIDDEHKKHVFDMFYQVNNNAVDEKRGIGLGLYLCKAILDVHNATIDIKDNVPQGTNVIVEFKRSYI